jgi:hypothetical protein
VFPGLLLLLLVLGLVLTYVLWSDQLKSKWYTLQERRKWERWNGPKAGAKKL